MSTELEAAVIVAAQAGDQQARDRLVAESLPLVYNIVGRALHGHADVDDVAQETMLRVLSSLDGLREPGSFRSWLVAVTMNQVRGHWLQHQAVPADGGREGAYDIAGPRADFVDLAIIRLGLSGQRREIAEATRWLDEEDHEPLSLWWLEAAGELTRTEVAAALELSPQHTAVRVQRMKTQLETSRVVVRAVSADPRCVLLEPLVEQWDGMPSAPWRKRIARHVRDCTVCSGFSAGLVPAERLLVGLALVPLATAFAPSGAPDFVGVSDRHEMSPGGGRAETRDALRRSRRTRRRRAAAVTATVAALVTAGGAVHLFTGEPEEDVMQPSVATAAEAVLPLTVVTESASPSASPSPTRSSESPKPSPAGSPPAGSPPAGSPPAGSLSTLSPPTRSPSTRPPEPPEPGKPAPRASAAKPAPAPAPDAGGDRAAFIQQVTQLVNAERAKWGCAPVSANGRLVAAAQRHSEDMAARHYFSHTTPGGRDPGDRIEAAGYQWRTYGENIARGHQSPADVMNGWMNSPGHRANILNCTFREIGIGVHDASGGPWWTQAFGARS